MHFTAVEGRMNAGKFIIFLKRLVHNAERPVFVIVDGHPSHRARKALDFVRSTDGQRRPFFLQPYSPALNPDEPVWNHLKTHGIGEKTLRSREELTQAVYRHMRSLQKTPATIQTFFRERHVRYAIN